MLYISILKAISVYSLGLFFVGTHTSEGKLVCEDGWKLFENDNDESACLYASTSYSLTTWSTAESWCRIDKEANLVTIHSGDKNDFIYNEYYAVLNDNWVWFGLSREDEDENWSWIDGSNYDYE